MAGQEVETHVCSVCSCDYTDDEGGIQGYFGILPVSFCPTCFSCMCDMASQYIDSDPDDTVKVEHDELIKHLQGIRPVVINGTYGGFGLSRAAELAYLHRTGTAYTLVDREDRAATIQQGQRIMVNRAWWNSRALERDDPVLVSVVREMGAAANGESASLCVVEIPANIEWQIEEYDGREWVAEKHRTWS
jgi:hypothetical protein